MKTRRFILLIILVVVAIQFVPLSAQTKLGDNAALRYWAAFAQMQDTAINSDQVKEIDAILNGNAPYDDSKYNGLVEKNKLSLELMAHGAALQNCDWGMDYVLGDETPVDYARKAMILGRLNVLYSFHLLINKEQDQAVSAIVSGLRFSQDVANGGTLFSTLVAQSLLVSHLHAIDFALHTAKLSPAQRLVLEKAINRLGADGLDWKSAMTRELSLQKKDWYGPVALTTVIQSYLKVLNDQSTLPKFQQLVASLPMKLQNMIPNAKGVAERKRFLTDKLQQEKTALR